MRFACFALAVALLLPLASAAQAKHRGYSANGGWHHKANTPAVAPHQVPPKKPKPTPAKASPVPVSQAPQKN